MKYILEKEKKLENALGKLKKIDFKNSNISKNLEELLEQKNQLEIEKNDLEKKYMSLNEEHSNLKRKIKDIKAQKNNDRVKQLKINEKIDELNQETDSLLDEIEKWQM